jgi:hypothetical protein
VAAETRLWTAKPIAHDAIIDNMAYRHAPSPQGSASAVVRAPSDASGCVTSVPHAVASATAEPSSRSLDSQMPSISDESDEQGTSGSEQACQAMAGRKYGGNRTLESHHGAHSVCGDSSRILRGCAPWDTIELSQLVHYIKIAAVNKLHDGCSAKLAVPRPRRFLVNRDSRATSRANGSS